jgi:hypothetical protein
MKSLFSLIAIVAGLFVLERCFVSVETFTEGIRVSPETVTLKSGQYVLEPEQSPPNFQILVAQKDKHTGATQ